MTKRDPMDEVRRTLAQLKASGVTISYTPAPGVPAGAGDRAMAVLHEEAKKLGMTYGDEDSATETEVGL